jgi:hypothetical protein
MQSYKKPTGPGGMTLKTRNMVSATALAAIALVAAAGSASATSDPSVLSPANQALFTSNHLASIKEPTVITYDFEKKGSLEDGFKDTIEADIKAVNSDGKDLSFHFLTGPNHIEFREFEARNDNPVFILFLERDVRELQRLTKGNALYYRERIRNALAETGNITDTTFEFNGKTVKGKDIKIEPFAKDPMNERYPRFAKKTYEFILSDEVPGGFYKIETVAPDPSGTQPLVDESMTFHEAHADAGAGKQAAADKTK